MSEVYFNLLWSGFNKVGGGGVPLMLAVKDISVQLATLHSSKCYSDSVNIVHNICNTLIAMQRDIVGFNEWCNYVFSLIPIISGDVRLLLILVGALEQIRAKFIKTDMALLANALWGSFNERYIRN